MYIGWIKEPDDTHNPESAKKGPSVTGESLHLTSPRWNIGIWKKLSQRVMWSLAAAFFNPTKYSMHIGSKKIIYSTVYALVYVCMRLCVSVCRVKLTEESSVVLRPRQKSLNMQQVQVPSRQWRNYFTKDGGPVIYEYRSPCIQRYI